MIVYSYELLSQSVHNYVAPSDRSYYNLSVFTSQGYLVLEPDIVFRPRQPGWSVVECITAGVRKVIQMGMVDPKRIGVVGHSMGGFNTAFLATNTNGIFAAAVAGAPITDMVSYYGDHHWSSGIAETDHIETGQERMEVPLYEDLKDYIDNSAILQRPQHDRPAPARGRRPGRHRGLAPGHRAVQRRPAGREERRDARLHGRGPRPAPGEESDRLPAPHPGLVRALPERRARRALDH